MVLRQIATIRSPFKDKLGIPKQSGLVEELEGEIIFEPEFRNPDYIRGLEGFEFIWLIWEFSANRHGATSPLVRPPVLGGNDKMGVFATRSPFRPNNIGLSSVRLVAVDFDTKNGPTLRVKGADLMDGTPIYDIKPYIPYADSHPDARSGFVDANPIHRLKVVIPDDLSAQLSAAGVTKDSDDLTALIKTLELAPRPHYHNDPAKTYGMRFRHLDIHFQVQGDTCTVTAITHA